MIQLVALALCVLSWTTAAAQESAPSPARDASFRLHGRLVDPAGAPVEGVSLSLTGGARVQGALPAPRECTTNHAGAFELSFDVEPATSYDLIAQHSDYGDIAWRWPTLPPPSLTFETSPATARELDLGTVTLRPLATLCGHLLDEGGTLLTAGWSVRVQERLGPSIDIWREPQARVVWIDAATGQFEVTDLGAGPVRVTAQGDGGRRQTTAFAVTVAGEVTRVELVDASPDPEKRLQLKIGSSGGVLHAPQRGTVFAVDEDGLRIRLEPQVGGRAWLADGVPRGDYRLVVADPRFARWELADVRPGTSPTARLVGSAGLAVEVLDEASAASVDDYELSVEYIEHPTSARKVTLRAQGGQLPEEGRYSGLVPESCVATVVVAGCVPSIVDVAGLVPGEVRRLVFRVGRGVALEGRLLELDGTPLSGADVALTRGEVPGLDAPRGGSTTTGMRTANGNRSVRVPARHGALRSAPDGSFRFEGLSPGRHTVSVRIGTHAIRDWPVDVTRVSAPPVELRMPARGTLDVQLVPRVGVQVSGAMLFLTPARWLEDHTIEPALWPTRTSEDRPLADELGRFAALEVVSGTWDVGVVWNVAVDAGEPVSWHFQRPGLDVQPGEVERIVIDLEREWPTRVHLVARAEGAPARSGGVALLRAGSAPTLEARSYVYGWRSVQTNALGEREEWVAPGTYRVVAIGQGWRWTASETIEIGATEPAPIEVTVPLVSGSIRVVDERGAPRTGLALEWWMGDSREFPVQVQTDALGCFEVTAPRGTLQAAITRKVELDVYGRPLPGWRAKAFGPAVASLEWGAPDTAAAAKSRDIVIPRAVGD